MIWPSLPREPSHLNCGRQVALSQHYFCSHPLTERIPEEVEEEDKFDRSDTLSAHNQGSVSLVRKKATHDGSSRLHAHNQVPFVSEIRALCQQGKLDSALQRLLLRDRLCSTRDVYLCLLKTCIQQQALPQAMQIYAHLVQHKADLTGVVVDYLVVTLAKCGGIELARQISATLPRRSVFSWTSMISAYTDAGDAHEALNMYHLMLDDGVEPDHYTFVSLLKACGSIPDLERGKQLHHEARRMGYASDVFVGNTLVSMYGKCGDVLRAENVFIGLLVHDEVAYNAMLSVYVEQGCPSKVLQLYRQMQDQRIGGNELTFGITIQACHALAEEEDAFACMKEMALEVGRALHHDARKLGHSWAFVANMLVSLYGKCGRVSEAEAVFCMLPTQDPQFWTIMLSVYIEQSQGEKALQIYRHMLLNDMHSDSYMLVTALQACSALSDKKDAPFLDGLSAEEVGLNIGMALHQDARSYGFNSDVYVATALLTMYGKFGSLVEAEDVFHNLSQRTIVSWTAMLSAYVEQGEHSKALFLFQAMQDESIPLDEVTILCALQACSEVGNLDICKHIHLAVLSAGGYGKKVGALVHSYASCGSMADASAVFDELGQPNVVAWSGCMAGYAGEGNCAASLKMLEAMRLSGVNPNDVTFASILSACSHSGLASEGLKYFDSMDKDYCIYRELKHFVNMTDLLGRAGNFKKLEGILSRMPMEANLTIWLCLLGMCLRHGNVELGKQAFSRATNLEPTDAVTYILMSNLYAESAFEMNVLGLVEDGSPLQ